MANLQKGNAKQRQEKKAEVIQGGFQIKSKFSYTRKEIKYIDNIIKKLKLKLY